MTQPWYWRSAAGANNWSAPFSKTWAEWETFAKAASLKYMLEFLIYKGDSANTQAFSWTTSYESTHAGATDPTNESECIMDASFCEASSDLKASGWSVTIGNVSEATLQTILSIKATGYQFQGQVFLWWWRDSDPDATAYDSFSLSEGYLSDINITDDAESASIVFSFENELAFWDKAIELTYSPEDQALIDATDKGFDFVSQVGKWNGFWGVQKVKQDKKATSAPSKKRRRR